MKYIDMETKIKKWYKALSPIYKKSFWFAFALINIAFSFHTINFMFGDHDWNYVSSASSWNEGAFEGRPLHFILQSIFFNGQVLPILNNLMSFAAMALSGILLARYWRIPNSLLNYTLFSTFIAILPLTLAWLFYAKDCLINLSLPLIMIAGLSLSDINTSLKNYWWHFIAIIIFYFAFASYIAILNLLAVCLLGRVLIDYASGIKLIDIIKQKLSVIVDIIVALMLFKLTLVLSQTPAGYNTEAISLDILPQKFIETLKVMFTQLLIPIPFMEYKYKSLLFILLLMGICFVIDKGGIRKLPIIVLLILAVLFASKLAFFIADERGQVLAELENFAFVPRLDFYGLAYVYALGLAAVLIYTKGWWYKLGITLAIIITFMSGVRDMYAQKVWKLGFDAEMKAHERIVSRLEQMPNFYADHKYRLLQIGSLSLRSNYYIKEENEATSLDLLSTSFTPQYMSRIVYNFYYPEHIFSDNAVISDLSEVGKNYLRHQATVWPMQGSIFIDGNIVIIVLTEEGLKAAKEKL